MIDKQILTFLLRQHYDHEFYLEPKSAYFVIAKTNFI